MSDLTVSKLCNITNKVNEVKNDICDKLSIREICNFPKITCQSIADCGPLKKSLLAQHLLNIISVCEPLSEYSIDFEQNNKLDIHEIQQVVSTCITRECNELGQSNEFQLHTIRDDIKKLDDLVNEFKTSINSCGSIKHLQSISDSLATKISDNCSAQNQNFTNDTNNTTKFGIDKNPTKCIDRYEENFISSDKSKKLCTFLDSCDQFSSNIENGHSVAMFGYPYHYTGSTHSDNPPDIPVPLQEVIDDINKLYPDATINSVLVNKYSGPGASLPPHADDEFTINPDSFIFTVSLGHAVDVKFTEMHSSDSPAVHKTIQPNSLYVMSHVSQSYWKHGINKCSTFGGTDVRYSLTFRHVSNKFLRSAVIIGDSNTRELLFGEGIGTFGHNIPGRRTQATHIDDINPVDCCGFNNIFLHCGINNIKHPSINGPDKVAKCFEDFKHKVEQISNICPKSKIFISPMLLTKDRDLNKRALFFNKLLFNYENQSHGKFSTLDFNKFCDNGFLSHHLGSLKHPDDKLHLGTSGIKLLVQLIRYCVYGYERKSFKKSNNHEKDGKLYRSVLTSQGAHDGSLPQT